ncbi:MAG: alpha-amylase family glycosyl hydrolase [Ilumatobacteraceae bacterium]
MGREPLPLDVRVHAPSASAVWVVVVDDGGATRRIPAQREGTGQWRASTPASTGDRYRLDVDGLPLVDPHALDVVVLDDGPWGVVRAAWPRHSQRARLADRVEQPIVYELHVKGFGGGYLGCIDRLDHIVSLGVDVIELMPVHPFDDRDNYWGYMPIVWGAVHRRYASEPHRAAEELAALVEASHARGIDVWLDVVFNHTGEGGSDMPPLTLRGLDPALHRRHADGTLLGDSGCGNDIDPSHPYVRTLVLEALDRYADLGVDGFRFDLASLLTRDGGGLIELVTAWAEQRGIDLVAEPWDLGAYQVGRGWPWPSWRQWNDRFRDDVRGLLRGEPGLVHAVRRRVEGSPDLFAEPAPFTPRRSVNFVTAHDGLTMHDLAAVTSDRHRSWDTGPDLRLQQLKNYFTVLLLSAGSAMWVMGDEFGRSQDGHDNPYDVDGPQSWVDWSRAAEWSELTDAVRTLAALRRRHPRSEVAFHGVDGAIDESYDSRSLAWSGNGLYVMANAWWEPLEFAIGQPGHWAPAFWSASFAEVSAEGGGLRYRLAPRSALVLEAR